MDLNKLEVLDICLTTEQKEKLKQFFKRELEKSYFTEEETEDILFGEELEEFTPQDILREYNIQINNINRLIIDNLGLKHITDKLKETKLLIKSECRKALGNNKEYLSLLD